MKRKLLICSSLITLLISVFSVPIYAETTTHDDAGSTPISSTIQLDSYFYDNYDLLPYIQTVNDYGVYIDTGIAVNSNLDIDIWFSDLTNISNAGLFGVVNSDRLYMGYLVGNNNIAYSYGYGSATSQTNDVIIYPYQISHFYNRQNVFHLNDIVKTVADNTFSSNATIPIFANRNAANNSISAYSYMKLYKFTIYDRSLNDGEGGYVRYYYPAKAKSSGIIGLYDSINKTFVTSSSSYAFTNPINDNVESFQISSFLTASLGWIGQIFTAIIDMPIIIIFMAIGLAGAMFRWGRRIVHF